MRCAACDKILSDFERTRKSKESGHYVDLCNRCFAPIRGLFRVEEREDLRCYEAPTREDYTDEEHDDE